MNARMTRLKKEVRALFWPWCSVMIAGASPIILPHSYAEPLSFLSFFVGVPLLATLPLGSEFQQRTVSLWLTQPLRRMQLWGEKMMVTFPAVLSAALVSAVVMFSFTWPDMRPTYRVIAIVYVIISMASATFLTLTARSTVGGLIVILCMLFAGSLFGAGNADLPAAAIAVICGAGVCFAGLMLWLGARKLVRFQATGATSGEDLLMSGPSVVPQAFAAWFRSRTAQPVLNLIRKELRLLRPVWVIESFVLLYLVFLGILWILPSPALLLPETILQEMLLGPPAAVCIGLAGLAGILSLGEEKSSGTHGWHMTLPISARRQWLIKLVMAVFVGLACAIVFPVLAMIAGGTVWGSPLMYVNLHSLRDDIVLFAILTFTCFWCACAANGTVRAAMWAVPVTAAIPLAGAGGIWLGQELTQNAETLKDFIVSSFHLSPFAFTTITEYAHTKVLWLFVPALLIALIQSYPLFRAQPQNSALWMLRCLTPVVAVTILWSFSASAGFLSSRWAPFEETRQALDKFERDSAKLELTGEDLKKNSSLTAPTRRWLSGASITVAADHSHLSGYVATIRLASGQECKLTVAHSGGAAASCRT